MVKIEAQACFFGRFDLINRRKMLVPLLQLLLDEPAVDKNRKLAMHATHQYAKTPLTRSTEVLSIKDE